MLKGSLSLDRMTTCHLDLQIIFNKVAEYFDYIIVFGFRDQEEQHKAFIEGKSKLEWPNSKHNQIPSLAIDVIPCDKDGKIDWNDTKRIYYFAGHVMAIAKNLKEEGKITHELRFGGDWDRDTYTKNNSFNDLTHYELV